MITDYMLKDIFKKYRTIAVYGMSKSREKAAHYVPAFLLGKGYAIIPVNPTADEIINLKCYSGLKDIAQQIDILQVFRPSAQVPAVVQEALDRKKARGDIKVIWLQDGIYNEEARKLAEQAGITFIQDRCMMKEFKRLSPKGE
jgi:predicted CoA-binding protein